MSDVLAFAIYFKEVIKEGKPLQTEFEEIKAEIEAERDKLKMKNFNVITGMEVGIDIIDKHIPEPKGANNGTQ